MLVRSISVTSQCKIGRFAINLFENVEETVDALDTVMQGWVSSPLLSDYPEMHRLNAMYSYRQTRKLLLLLGEFYQVGAFRYDLGKQLSEQQQQQIADLFLVEGPASLLEALEGMGDGYVGSALAAEQSEEKRTSVIVAYNMMCRLTELLQDKKSEGNSFNFGAGTPSMAA